MISLALTGWTLSAYLLIAIVVIVRTMEGTAEDAAWTVFLVFFWPLVLFFSLVTLVVYCWVDRSRSDRG